MLLPGGRFAVPCLFSLFAICMKIYRKLLELILPFVIRRTINELKDVGLNVKGQGPLGIIVYDMKEFCLRLATEHSVGLLEADMDGICRINNVRALMSSIMGARITKKLIHPMNWVLDSFNLQSIDDSWQVGIQHYDVGNRLYEAMLDKNMQYTCGYWRSASTLDEAQVAKMDLVARKLKLVPGMRVLELGCGFGTFAIYLAKHYQVSVVGCSISKEQIKYGRERAEREGVNVELRLEDYRNVLQQSGEKFDRIVSIGMLEHVGRSNYRSLFRGCTSLLKDDGLMVLHTIGNNHRTTVPVDVWNHKYIFPNGSIPYFIDVCKAVEDLWIIEDWQNIGINYVKTLEAWETNFDAAWEDNLSLVYDKRFYRMWKIYLQIAQAFFDTRSFQLWQIVLSKIEIDFCVEKGGRGYQTEV